MAQKRFIEYQDPISSFAANEKYAGIIPPSVYNGFDTIQGISGLTFQLNHLATGEVFTNENGTTSNPRGIWVTKQGVVIKEDEPIALSLLANPNNYERWDVLVGEHTYDSVSPGGIPANYVIIPGGNKTEPTINDAYQVVLGRIYVPANATTAAGIKWEKRRVPQIGGDLPALLHKDNRFLGQINENQGSASMSITDFEIAGRGVVQGLTGGNSFLVTATANANVDLLPAKPIGTEVSLTFNNPVKLRGFGDQVSGEGAGSIVAGVTSGYRPLNIHSADPLKSLILSPWETATFRLVSSGGNGTRKPFGEYWALVGLTNNSVYAREAHEAVGDIEVNITDLQTTTTELETAVEAQQTQIGNHINDTNNPHSVTKAQVGLGAIPNSISSDPASNSADTLATTALTAQLKTTIDTLMAGLMPKGAIIMWSGSPANIPDGFVICKGGASVNGVAIPDLRSRFIVGASDPADNNSAPQNATGATYTVGANSGTTLKNSRSLTLANMPPHSHAIGVERIQRSRGASEGSSNMWWGNALTGKRTEVEGGSGGSAQPLDFRPPYYALLFLIKVV